MNSIEGQIQEEIRQILEVVEERTGLPSRWNGHVELVLDADFKGKKRFSCDILIHASLAQQDSRWSTLIHEALHAVSVGYQREDYQQFRGWEEGVVEKLQRLMRPAILTTLGVTIPEERFQASEATHLYNVYIRALEEIRLALEAEVGPDDEQTFYIALLSTPLRDRPGYVLGLGYQRIALPRASFIRAFSAANAILTRRPL